MKMHQNQAQTLVIENLLLIGEQLFLPMDHVTQVVVQYVMQLLLRFAHKVCIYMIHVISVVLDTISTQSFELRY